MTHSHDHPAADEPPGDIATMFTAPYWDERYGGAASIWSGNPNQRLVEQASDLAPGRALDVGCGEGADAIWLARRGWQVTAVDVSSVALERAAQLAASAGPEVSHRIAWRQADLRVWAPEPSSYDLVSAHFMYLPQPALRALHGSLAAAVRPGGTLLIVGHDPTDLHKRPREPQMAELMYTATDVAAVLEATPDGAAQWDIEVCEVQPRVQPGPDGEPMQLNDAVLRARRR